jgi:hypothetical protein
MPFVMYDLGQREQLRTELQAGSAHSVGIDRKSHVVVLESELYSSARRCKTIVSPTSNTFDPLQTPKDFCQMRAL